MNTLALAALTLKWRRRAARLAALARVAIIIARLPAPAEPEAGRRE